jgi:GTP-binding protein Era
VLERLDRSAATCVLVVNKLDLLKGPSAVLPLLEECQRKRDFAAIVPVSALKGDNLDRLMDVVLSHLPSGDRLFPPGIATDRSTVFRIAELLREKLTAGLQREVPYGLAVELSAFEDSPGLARIEALIWLAKESQRPIVLGRGGVTLREIGRAARLDMEQLLGKKVFLQMHVRVRRNWADDARALRQFGYEADR